MTQQKAETIVSPVGTAAYSWLLKPDTAFNQNHYKITLLLDKTDDDSAAFVKKIDAAHKGAANGHSTPSPVKDGNKSKAEGHDGHWLITAKTKFAPKLVDTERHMLPDNLSPMSGDLIRLAFAINPYDTGSASGVSLRLRAVQLVEKRNEGGNVGDVFDDIDGFTADTATAEDEEDF